MIVVMMPQENDMEKIEHAQTILTESELNKLKKKAGTTSTTDALRSAVDAYINPKKAVEV